jgi:hypothetical protein
MDSTKKPAASQDPEVLRKKILSDPNTAQIAKNLGVPLEDYVNQVLHFVLNPHEEPNLYVVEDAALRGMGYEPPDADAMGQYIIDAATVAQAAAPQSGFVDEKKKKLVELPDARAGAAPQAEDPQLKAELDKRRTGRGQG